MVEAAWTTGKAVITGSNNWVVDGSATIPEAWTGTIKAGAAPFSDIAQNDLRPAEGCGLIAAGNAHPASTAGFEFPSPLPLPLCEPPFHAKASAARARPQKEQVDIGAYSFGSGRVISSRPALRGKGSFSIGRSGNNLYCLLPPGARGVYSVTLFSINGKRIGGARAESEGGRISGILRQLGNPGVALGCYLIVVASASEKFEGQFYYY
jgi:hypothetical protein